MIPKQFKILNHTIDVIFDNEYCYQKNAFGIFLANENKIILADSYRTKKQWRKYKPEIVEHVFHHEMVHVILYYMNHSLFENEEFVDNFAGLLAQIEQTKKYEINESN
jgi:hypothetical protein